jgi:hypothetical protein
MGRRLDIEDGKVPRPKDVYEEILPELQSTQTKTEARDVLRPLSCVAGIYELMSDDEEAPFGGGAPLMVSRVTALTEEEVEDEIEKQVWEWIEVGVKSD